MLARHHPLQQTCLPACRCLTLCKSLAQMPTKRKVAVIDESPDEEGELVQSERTVRVASARNAIRKQPTDSDRQPASSRLGVSDNGTAGTLQPRPRIGSRLSRPAAGQAPLRAPLEVRHYQHRGMTKCNTAIQRTRAGMVWC